MSLLRQDLITGRRVLFPDKPVDWNAYRVKSWEPHVKDCPFCEGHESMTPPEIEAPGRVTKKPNTPGWKVRVVPNRYPALDSDTSLKTTGTGFYESMTGFGFHEVIVENPCHEAEFDDLKPDECQAVLEVWKERYLYHSKNPSVKYVLVFKNHGASAGASIVHPHGQLIALPFVPDRAEDEYSGASRYYQKRGRCVYCDFLKDAQISKLMVLESRSFVAMSPSVPGHPYELILLPRKHASRFELISSEEIRDLGRILKDMLKCYKTRLNNPSYNLMLHSVPMGNTEEEKSYDNSFHWHIEIMPRLIRSGGLEWSARLHLNPVSPQEATRFLLGHNKRPSV